MAPLQLAHTPLPRRYVALVLLVFLVPVVSGMVGHLTRMEHWFNNAQGTECAALRILDGQPYYDTHLACEGLHPSVYVYHPVVAYAAAAVVRLGGVMTLEAGYMAFYAAAMAVLLWLAFGTRRVPGEPLARVPFAGLIPAKVLLIGNIAQPVHALVGLAALVFESRPLLLLGVVSMAGTIKPVFLTYLVVFLLAPWPLARRLGYVAAGAVLGLAPTAWFLLTGGETALAWRAVLDDAVAHRMPGVGFLQWMHLLGANLHASWIPGAYVLYAGLLVSAALQVVAHARMDVRERVWLGIALAALLNPRLMHQDCMLLAPGMVALALAARRIAPGLREALGERMGQVLMATCLIVMPLTLAGSRLALSMAVLVFAGMLVWAAAVSARQAGPRALDGMA